MSVVGGEKMSVVGGVVSSRWSKLLVIIIVINKSNIPSGNSFFAYAIKRHVFPTAPSPTTTHLIISERESC